LKINYFATVLAPLRATPLRVLSHTSLNNCSHRSWRPVAMSLPGHLAAPRTSPLARTSDRSGVVHDWVPAAAERFVQARAGLPVRSLLVLIAVYGAWSKTSRFRAREVETHDRPVGTGSNNALETQVLEDSLAADEAI
jgi:hypothetical protein